MLFSAVAVNLNKVGFNFTTDQLFLLTALPSLSGAILRVPYSFMVPIFGGRYWTVLSTVILMVPCIWLGRHSEPRYSILGIYHHCPAVRFCRRELCFQHGKYQFFLSQSETGQRAGYQRRPRQSRRQRDADGRAGGDFSADLHFFGVHGVPQEDGSSPLSNAALVWVPLLLIATFAAWFGMNDIASSKASIRDQLPVLKRPHMWLLSLLYLATFGSFIGFSAGFAMLAKTQFPDVNILKLAFFGPFIGALARSFGGISPTVSAACGSRW
jgi:NNP family nitrate/nitrite transporter-like MFS transporter